jgi:hypothetical protein
MHTAAPLLAGVARLAPSETERALAANVARWFPTMP